MVVMRLVFILKGNPLEDRDQHTSVLKRTTIMVSVIIVALIGSDVTPEYVNFTNQERIILAEFLPKCKIVYTIYWIIISNKLI